MRTDQMNIGEALAWLDGHVNLEAHGAPPGRRVAAPTLDRIAALTALLGSPQVAYPVIHCTGTNGKTSVVRLTAELLGASGLSVGSYTSPHLQRVHERLDWNGDAISDEALAEQLTLLADIEPHLDERPSYFELLTAAAFRWFADVAVDVGVVEVGLGGRWDATNVADGQVAVVTNVSIDHVEFLGSERREIAEEKAGIVKTGATLVLGETDPGLLPAFSNRGQAATLRREVDFEVQSNRLAHGGRQVGLVTPEASYEDLFLSLHGAHQAENAAIALTAAEVFVGRPLDRDLVADVLANVRAPGRLEAVAHDPLVLLDGAHNVAGAHALRAALAEEFPEARETLVVGLLREKEPHEMLRALDAGRAAHLIACRPPSARALDPELVAAAARDLGARSVEVVVDVADALDRARDSTPDDGRIVVTGSLYVVGLARTHLLS